MGDDTRATTTTTTTTTRRVGIIFILFVSTAPIAARARSRRRDRARRRDLAHRIASRIASSYLVRVRLPMRSNRRRPHRARRARACDVAVAFCHPSIDRDIHRSRYRSIATSTSIDHPMRVRSHAATRGYGGRPGDDRPTTTILQCNIVYVIIKYHIYRCTRRILVVCVIYVVVIIPI